MAEPRVGYAYRAVDGIIDSVMFTLRQREAVQGSITLANLQDSRVADGPDAEWRADIADGRDAWRAFAAAGGKLYIRPRNRSSTEAVLVAYEDSIEARVGCEEKGFALLALPRAPAMAAIARFLDETEAAGLWEADNLWGVD
jgi:hypothetical protein